MLVARLGHHPRVQRLTPTLTRSIRPRLAILLIVAALLPAAPAAAWRPAAGETAASVTPALTAEELRPPIVKKFIPFGKKRKAQMSAYSERHYGDHTYVLSDPKVIVQHFTTSHQMMDAWWYFANNTPARGELPGVCSHFLLDTDGTIYQVMPLTIRCRHATGLNNLAIGIEDVGVSDQEILGNRKMMKSSLALTVWLMAKYDIPVRDVIGHAEILNSPWHHDLVKRFQCMVHSDWSRPHMRIYRGLLRAEARDAGVPIGPAPEWVPSGC